MASITRRRAELARRLWDLSKTSISGTVPHSCPSALPWSGLNARGQPEQELRGRIGRSAVQVLDGDDHRRGLAPLPEPVGIQVWIERAQPLDPVAELGCAGGPAYRPVDRVGGTVAESWPGSMTTSPRSGPAIRTLGRPRSPWTSSARSPAARLRASRSPARPGPPSPAAGPARGSAAARSARTGSPPARPGPEPAIKFCVHDPQTGQQPGDFGEGWQVRPIGEPGPGSTFSRSRAPASVSASRRSTTCGVAAHARSASASVSATDGSGVSLSTTPRPPRWLHEDAGRPARQRLVKLQSPAPQHSSTSPGSASHHGPAPAPKRSISLSRAAASSTKSVSSTPPASRAAPASANHNHDGPSQAAPGVLLTSWSWLPSALVITGQMTSLPRSSSSAARRDRARRRWPTRSRPRWDARRSAGMRSRRGWSTPRLASRPVPVTS